MSDKASRMEEVQALVRQAERLLPRGGGSKPALSTPLDGEVILDMSGISGILEYVPEEYTFTALAGTPLSEVQEQLAAHGQYLPFDPPLAARGATLGGTVAADLSGPGRYHYGGLRDFLLGVRYVDSRGQIVQGGGKVVKNAAGFDLPKLMAGSLGGLGVFVELTFKVFPRAQAYATIRLEYENLETVLEAKQRAESSRVDLDALDIEATPTGYTLYVRLGGLAKVLPERRKRLQEHLGGGEVIEGDEEGRLWQAVGAMDWAPEGWSLVKVPLTPGRIPALEGALVRSDIRRRYLSGGQLAWLASAETPSTLGELLSSQGLNGLVLSGPPGVPLLGEQVGGSFLERIKKALDPGGKFVGLRLEEI